MRGENSNILVPDAAERFAAALPLGKLVTVPNCGHNVHGQNTKGFIAAVDGFLETLLGNGAQPTNEPSEMPPGTAV